jgi:1-acyl-sn-glycerol-3-phosphate acyltransferase
VREVSSLAEEVSSVFETVPQRVDAALRSWRLLERSRWFRRVTGLAIAGIEVESIPASLEEGKRAILVSNYPSVTQTLRAVIKVGCLLPGKEARLKAIAREELVTGANALHKALGVAQNIFPAHKNSSGKYTVETKTLKKILAHLNGHGSVLWLSITGNTRGNGLAERDLRTGAALFSLKKQIPVVPTGMVTTEKDGRPKVVGVRFGEPIVPPQVENLDELEMGDLLVDISRLAMCQIAALLPPGQRGDFENVEEKLGEVKERLGLL